MPAGSPLQRIEDVDRAGVRIASGKNAYDLYLSPTLKHAQFVHAPSSPGAIELFVSEKLDATAGVKQQLLAFAKTHRMCTGRFMAIEQTMGTPKAGMWEPVTFVRSSRRSRPPGSSGFVAEALERSGQADTTVAPPSPIQ